MSSNELLFSSATRMLSLLRSREVSSRELVDAHLAQIARVNPRLNAIVTLTAESARREADESDRRLARGDARPLEGLPVTIKDTVETAGVRSTGGTKLFEDYVPVVDAPVVARWKAAGAIMLGKTNAPELALDFDCENPVFGATHNPWDLERVPGGSSGGEAAAIASGCSPLGLGTDLGGSIRIPAHFCGIAGLKPTVEAVPRTGHVPAGVPPLPIALMATFGPMARAVEDLALAFNLARGPYHADPYIVPSPPAAPETVDVRRLACAFYVDGGPTPVEAPIREAVRSAARVLADAGVRVEEHVPRGFATAHQVLFKMILADGGEGFRMMAGSRYDEYRPQLRRMLESQPTLSVMEFFFAGIERDVFRADLALLMEEWPIILGPTLPIAAFRREHDGHDIEGQHFDHIAPLWGTDWVNLAGLPAAVVPAGTTPDGLPIGVQVVGPRFGESEVLAVAAVIERELGGYRRPPVA